MGQQPDHSATQQASVEHQDEVQQVFHRGGEGALAPPFQVGEFPVNKGFQVTNPLWVKDGNLLEFGAERSNDFPDFRSVGHEGYRVRQRNKPSHV